MRAETVLVTGGTSPLGDVLMPRLISSFDSVIGVVRSREAATRMTDLGASYAIWDLNSETPPPVLKADILVHGAGIRLAQGATILGRACGTDTNVAISSASAMAPSHPSRAELLSAERSFTGLPRAMILRPTMIYGSPRDNNVRRLNLVLARLPAVPRFTGGARITPVLVDELCLAAGHRRVRVSVPVPMLAYVGRATRRHFGKVAHALEMLVVDRSASAPNEVGFSYSPTELSAGIRLALHRYQSGR